MKSEFIMMRETYRKRFFQTVRQLMVCIMLSAMVSCGELFDFEIDNPDVIVPTEMHLNTDNLFMMVGDTCSVFPVWTPDSVTALGVYWESANTDVVMVENGLISAVGEGTAMIRAISVSGQLADSCRVNVSQGWSFSPQDYQYDMVVYANVVVDGEVLNENLDVCAMVDNEVRGHGVIMKHGGISYLELRIYSNQPANEQIEFFCYHRKRGRILKFPQTLVFDGESHGTLNNLFQLVIGQ